MRYMRYVILDKGQTGNHVWGFKGEIGNLQITKKVADFC